jgi:hypothetical protein
MNEQSLKSANDFLSVAATTVAPGEFFDRPPTEIGRDAGIPNPLAVARAIRALAARRRVEMLDGRYRLLDATPLSPGEPESVPRTPRKRKPRKRAGGPSVDRLIEMGRETGEALGLADNLRREVKENRAARIDAEQRSSRYFERIKELEHKLEMAEANLRQVLAAARGRGATAAPPDNEMEAVLRVLKGTPSRDGQDGAGVDEDTAASDLSSASLDAVGGAGPANEANGDTVDAGSETGMQEADADGAGDGSVTVAGMQDAQTLDQPRDEVHEAFGE